jgi:indole-3-glycerol phosphate synthase
VADILKQIEESKRGEIATAKRSVPPVEMESRARSMPRPRGFIRAIERSHALGRPALIAEIKKASPSRGLIRADFEPAGLARAYTAGGATCLSVLTDRQFFQGSARHMKDARVASDLPVLRKDFIYEPYQAFETRALGADALLIIMAAVDDAAARAIETAALDVGLDVLIEVHDEAELARALRLKSRLIGINNRDLHTFMTSLNVAERLAPGVPKDRIVVGESGIFTPADIARLKAVGVSTYLVGESLMREADVAAATRRLLGEPATDPIAAAASAAP